VPQPKRFLRRGLRTVSTVLAAVLLFTVASTPIAIALQPRDQSSTVIIGDKSTVIRADSTVVVVGPTHGSIVAAVVIERPSSSDDGPANGTRHLSGLCGVFDAAQDARVAVRWYALLPQMRSIRVLPGPKGRYTDVTASSAELRSLQLGRRGQVAYRQDALIHSCALIREQTTLRSGSRNGSALRDVSRVPLRMLSR